MAEQSGLSKQLEIFSPVGYEPCLSSGTPPEVLKRAVTLIPKVIHPTSFKDLRPIYVTSILSRLFERLTVHKFLIPALPKQLYFDQFAFLLTGSTTAASIYVLHHVTHLLETN